MFMSSPLTIGTTAISVAIKTPRRVIIKFQNTGDTKIYLKKIPTKGTYTIVSPTDYEILLYPNLSQDNSNGNSDKSNSNNKKYTSVGIQTFNTNSIAGFMAISSEEGGLLAVYETKKI